MRRVAEAKAQKVVARRLSLRGIQFDGQVHAGQVMLIELQKAVAHAATLAELVDESGQVVRDGEVTPLVRMLLDQHQEVARQARDIVKLGISAAKISAEQAEATAAEWRAAIRESGVLLSADDERRLASAFAERLQRRATLRIAG